MKYLLTATGIALSCLLTGLSGKGQQIVDGNSYADFVHDHHLKGKSTADYIQLVKFYNSSIKS